jgi:hypothetical protein
MKSFFQTLARSFYDISLYQEARSSWTGWLLGLTAVVFAIVCAIGITLGAVVIHHEFLAPRAGGQSSNLEEGLRQIAEQWPTVTLDKDTLTSDAPMPKVIAIDLTIFGARINEDVITVDTSGKTTYQNLTTPILISASELTIHKEDETRIRPLSELFSEAKQPLVIDRDYMQNFATTIVDATRANAWKFLLFFGIFTWVVLVPVLLFVRYLLVIPLAALGLIAAQIMRRTLIYDDAVRVIALALIPLTVIDAGAMFIFGSGVSSFIKALVALGVLVLVLQRDPKNTPTPRV